MLEIKGAIFSTLIDEVRSAPYSPLRPQPLPSQGKRQWEGGGGQNVSHDFLGGTTYCRVLRWRPQKVGFVWSVPVSSKENDIA